MTLLVENYYARGEYSLYDSREDRLVPIENKKELSLNFSGFYSNIDNELIVFFRNGGRLRLLLDGHVYDFDQLHIDVENKKNSVVGYELRWIREVTVTFCDHIVYKRKYGNFCQEFVDDPTPFMEPEDFDFYLFLRNVSKDSPRKERIFTNFVE